MERKRGINLYDGAYVLQLKVNNELLDTWTVKYIVGASYSYETHVGYFQMSRENAVLNSICDCFSGYVIGITVRCFLGHELNCLFFLITFPSSHACSHLYAVLRLLLDFNDPEVDTMLVSRV